MNTNTKNLSISAIVLTICVVSLAIFLNSLAAQPIPPVVEPVGDAEVVGNLSFTTGFDGGIGRMFFLWEERDVVIERDFVCNNSDYEYSATVTSTGNIREFFDPERSHVEFFLDRDLTQPAGTVPCGTVVHARIIQHILAGESYELPSYDYVLNWRNI